MRSFLLLAFLVVTLPGCTLLKAAKEAVLEIGPGILEDAGKAILDRVQEDEDE